jgi:hypothetical protein
MLDGQADEMIAVTDVVAEQFRKIAAGLLEQSERSSAGSSSMTVMMKCRAAAC